MPLVAVDLKRELEPLQWAIGGLILKGYLNTVASLPGEGKTATLTGLAWQASRPEGGEFAGRRVWPGSTIYLDFDAPGDGRNLRYWLTQHARAYPDGDAGKITVLEPDNDTYGLTEGDLQSLTETARELQAGLIIIDSFMAAFPNTDPVKLTQVQAPLWYLRRLATDLGAAVVLIDHLPKPVMGERAGARGIMGSIAKPAQSRSVHLLTRVPPKEVQGRHVLKWETAKLSYAALPEPFGLELVFDNGGVTFREAELPAEYAETRTDKAARAIQDHLEANRGLVVARKELLELACKEANVSRRSAEAALKSIVDGLGDELVAVKLPGRGGAVGYRLAAPTKTDCVTSEERAYAVLDGNDLTQSPTAELRQFALNPADDFDRLCRALLARLKAGTWPISNAAALLSYCKAALAGDDDARAAVARYLDEPGVRENLIEWEPTHSGLLWDEV